MSTISGTSISWKQIVKDLPTVSAMLRRTTQAREQSFCSIHICESIQDAYHPQLVETVSTKWKAVHWEKSRCFNNLKRSMFGEIPLINLNTHQATFGMRSSPKSMDPSIDRSAKVQQRIVTICIEYG